MKVPYGGSGKENITSLTNPSSAQRELMKINKINYK
jgi:hypothetical protein